MITKMVKKLLHSAPKSKDISHVKEVGKGSGREKDISRGKLSEKAKGCGDEKGRGKVKDSSHEIGGTKESSHDIEGGKGEYCSHENVTTSFSGMKATENEKVKKTVATTSMSSLRETRKNAEGPSFSLGCGLSQTPPIKPKSSNTDGVSKVAQFYAELEKDKNEELKKNKNKEPEKDKNKEPEKDMTEEPEKDMTEEMEIAMEVAARAVDKMIANPDTKIDSDFNEMIQTAIKKREVKPSILTRSPYKNRILDLQMKQHLDEKKIWNWIFNLEEPKE